MKDIIIDYLNNINGDYSYSNKFLGLKNGIFEDTKKYPKNGWK